MSRRRRRASRSETQSSPQSGRHRKSRWRKGGEKPSPSSAEPRDTPVSLEIRERRRIFTPFRLAIFCALLIAAVTGVLKFQALRRERASIELRDAVERAEAALKSGNIQATAEAYRKACAALDVLEQDDAEARSIRQKAREAAAVAGLADDSFFDMLQALPEPPQGGPSSPDGEPLTARTFTTAYGGSWIVLDTSVFVESSPEGSLLRTIDCPLQASGHPVALERNLPIFDQLPAQEQPHRVLFAARIRDGRLAGGSQPRWTITFRHDSAFLWTDFELYRALGFQPEDADAEKEIRVLLDRQRETRGLP